jgi:trimeric autotransporter adhesin
MANTTGHDNHSLGQAALINNTSGEGNVGVGSFAVAGNTTGNFNTGLGFGAGSNLTTGDNNIDIGNQGVGGESNTIRIGEPVAVPFPGPGGGTLAAHTATYIAGIYNATIAKGLVVKVDSTGHLGTVGSSESFKDAIKPMDKTSESILALKPVTFHYKKDIDPDGIPQFGLVAEQVEKVNPDLVARDEQGKVYSVRYEAVNAMLLNEFLKEHRTVQELKSTVAKQEATITQLNSTVAQQQKGMEVLAASLKEQAAQIQKVSAQLERSKPAPQVAVSNQ